MNFHDIHRQGKDLFLKEKEIFHSLNLFFDAFSTTASVKRMHRHFLSAVENPGNTKMLQDAIERLRPFYEEAVSHVEKEAAENGFKDDLLKLQRGLYCELEDLIASEGCDTRHHFFIVIPVADRPVTLKKCLESLLEQCLLYQYGGASPGSEGIPLYRKVSVFIVDDSKDKANIKKIREIGKKTMISGVRTYYIGLEEQTEILKQVPAESMGKLFRLLGGFSGSVPPHKGASISRNIASLYLRAVARKFDEKVLVYFIDSDEEFRIKIKRTRGEEDIHFINYFYWLDKIFRSGNVEVLTGKVVGDPPVSPSVMINTFLDDLILFLETASALEVSQPCTFHDELTQEKFSADYHDMGRLFGYSNPLSPRKYHCCLQGAHTLKDCFDDFSRRAKGFFFGLHPTRTQFYIHGGSFTETEKARTVYTGNYVFNAEGFRHFIPFAGLNLRMAGPTLGRILRKRLQEGFVWANLPLLHKRTVGDSYGNEFRSGIIASDMDIDLSGEYQRQFWGDVMLFSVEALSDAGFPDKRLTLEKISHTVHLVQDRLLNLYREKHAETAGKISRVDGCLGDPEQWWNKLRGARKSLDNFRSFCAVVESNFGTRSSFLEKISGQIGAGSYTHTIINAIHSFYEDDFSWNELLKADISVPCNVLR